MRYRCVAARKAEGFNVVMSVKVVYGGRAIRPADVGSGGVG
jgi:hypothetical protein